MYPTITEFLKSIGINLQLPIQMFGFFVAIAFGVAAWLLGKELQRKQAEGLLKPITKHITVGAPASTFDYVIAGLIGFLIGFKGLYMFFHYGELVNDPPGLILSLKGHFIGGILGCAGMVYLRHRESKAQLLPVPKEKTVVLNARDHVGQIILLGVIGGFVGAKIFHNLENWAEFMRDPIEALIAFSGLTFYGGLIVAAILIIRYGRKNGLPATHLTDAGAPTLMLTYGIGRIGCHVSGDGDWGIVNLAAKPNWMSFLPDWMWSFNYAHNVNNVGIPIPGCEGRWCHQLPEPVFPTSFYETLMCFALFGILWLIRKRITTPGLLFSIYLVMNGAERFLIEQIRVNTTYQIMGMDITQAQIISTLLMIAGLVGIWFTTSQKRNLVDGNAQ
jgi:phosphatidylglycerol:prolipoprotein diacylglycerol transferase